MIGLKLQAPWEGLFILILTYLLHTYFTYSCSHSLNCEKNFEISKILFQFKKIRSV